MPRVAVTEDGRYVGRFEWGSAARWSDGDCNGNGSGGAGRGEAVMRTAGGKWVLESWTTSQAEQNAYRYITGDEAQDWLVRNGEDESAERYFGDQREQEDRRVGRPAIGGEALIRLGDLLPEVDRFAEADGVTRAEWVRRAVEGEIRRRKNRSS